MNTETDWAQRLAKALDSFTKSEKEIADFIRQAPHEMAFLSLKELCSRVAISKPTAIEFYKKLGYETYQEFRSGIMGFYEKHIDSYNASSRIFSRISSFPELIQAAVDTDVKSLNLFSSHLAEEELRSSAEKILAAKTVYLYGPGTGFYPAHYLYHRLKRYKLNIQLAGDDTEHAVDSFFPAGRDDLLLAFMYMKNTNLFIKNLISAKGSGMEIITVTGTMDPVLAGHSDRLIYVNRGDIQFKNSMAVPMHFANLLLLAVELAGGETLKNHLKDWEEKRRAFLG